MLNHIQPVNRSRTPIIERSNHIFRLVVLNACVSDDE